MFNNFIPILEINTSFTTRNVDFMIAKNNELNLNNL